jgi:DNA polymerase elongation subunit (family B)
MTEKPLSPKDRALRQIAQRPLFFDLETQRHPEVEQWIERPVIDLEAITAPSNYKDEAKIAAYIERAQEEAVTKAEAEYNDMLAKAPLDPDYGSIRAIGVKMGADGEIGVLIVPQQLDWTPPETFGGGRWPKQMKVVSYPGERQMIQTFWEVYRQVNGESVGYNSIGFDLPYLLRRSMELKTPPSNRPDLRRYQLKPSTDLMGILYNWGRAKGLKFVCERYGIENPNPEWDGSMVSEMTDAEVCQYVAGDIFMVHKLYDLMAPIYFLGARR